MTESSHELGMMVDPLMLLIKTLFQGLKAFDVTKASLDERLGQESLHPGNIVGRQVNPTEVRFPLDILS